MSLKSKIEITSESQFREQAGLTDPITLEWEEGKVVEATQSALDQLKSSMAGKKAIEQRKIAEEFIAANEKKDAMEKLTEKLGGNILKNPAVMATATGVAASVGAIAHTLDKNLESSTGEKLGIMDSIRDWLKDSMESSTGFMKKIWGLLFKATGGKEETEESASDEEKNPDATLKNETFIQDEAYKFTAVYLLQGQDVTKYTNVLSASIGGIKDATIGKDDIEKKDAVMKLSANVLNLSSVRSQTYEQILQGGEQGIKSKIVGENPELATGAAMLIFQMLKNNESFLEKIFQESDPKWKEKSIESLLSTLYFQHGYNNMVKLGHALKDKSMASLDNIAQLPKNFFGSVDITATPPKFGGILSERFRELEEKGFTTKLAQLIMVDGSGGDSLLSNTSTILQGEYSESEKNFLIQLTEPKNFLMPFKASLQNRFNLPENLMDILTPNLLTFQDIFEIYAIMRGNPDVDILKQGDRGLLLAKLQFLFAKNNINAYTAYMAEVSKNPEQYKEILSVAQMVNSAINKGAYFATLKTTEGIKALLNSIAGPLGIDTTGEKIAAALGVSAVAIGIIVGAFMLLPAGIAITVLGLLVAGLGWTLVALAQNFIGVK